MTLFDNFHRPVVVTTWDGVTPWGKVLPYPPKDLFSDGEGNIWYNRKLSNGKTEASIWCTAERLEMHVHHIQQIFSR